VVQLVWFWPDHFFNNWKVLQRSRYSNRAVSTTIIAYGIGGLEKTDDIISYSIYGTTPLIQQSTKAKITVVLIIVCKFIVHRHTSYLGSHSRLLKI